ncbi:hypothetical protein F4802DRAFT_451715 [Xylaria palmicola]|nr:hypothetical protein F4802DRAFT_451715 [Xylaria palmicola]
MSWFASLRTVGALSLSALNVAARLLYVLSTPLRWLLYYVYASIIFLLSPLWFMANFGLGTVSFALSLITRFKYLYIYLACAAAIGVCAGFMLHGTSSFIFVLLGINTSSEPSAPKVQQHRPSLYASRSSPEEDRKYDEESSPNTSGAHLGRKHVTKIEQNDLFEKRWKLLRSPEQPSRTRKGLLAQTIHEESSESDF